MYSSQ